MHDDLYAYLTGTAAITALFGDRVYHEWVPQNHNDWPALTFQQVSLIDLAEDFDGPFASMDQARYQFDIIGDTSAQVVAAAETFDSVFRALRGTIGSTTVQHVSLGSQQQLGEMVGDKQRRRVSLDYEITYST